MIKRNLLVLVLFVLLISLVSAANVPTSIECVEDTECLAAELGEDSYCEILEGKCYKPSSADATVEEEEDNETIEIIIPTIDTSALKDKVDTLETTLGSINTKTSSLESDMLVVKNDLSNLKTQVGGIQAQLTQINTELSQGLGKIETSIATGLATLQGDLDSTQSEIDNLEKSSKSFRNIMLGLVVLLVALGGIWFLVRKPKQSGGSDMSNYISTHIKQGKSFQEIKQALLTAGWNETNITKVYKKTVQANYQKYLKNKEPKKKVLDPKNTAKPNNKKKIIIISIIGVIFLFGAFFFLSKTTGQAINFDTTFKQSEPLTCTSPHIVTEGGCCLDENANNICDTTEAENAMKAAVDAAICVNDKDCTVGKTCVDNSCTTVAAQFKTDCPGQFKCNLNNIKIKTSDGELYTVYANKGSYAAAGAIDWTVKEIPNYCQGEAIKIPLEIQKKDLVCYDGNGAKVSCNENTGLACSQDSDCNKCVFEFGSACTCENNNCKLKIVDKIKSEIIGKETIILSIGETSKKISHPNSKIDAKLKGFSLTIQDANEFCFPGN